MKNRVETAKIKKKNISLNKQKDQPSFRGNQGRDPLKNNRQRTEITHT